MTDRRAASAAPEENKELIVHVISGLEDAGAEGALYRLAANDPRFRHQVISLQGDGKYGPLLRDAGISVECLNMTPSNSVVAFSSLRSRLRNLSPGVVQTWMYEADIFGGLAARSAGIKNIHWSLRFSSVDIDGVPKWMARSIRLAPMLSRSVPKSVICCGERVREHHEQMGYCPEKMVVVRNGFDLEKLDYNESKRMKLRGELGLGPETTLIGMVARNDPQKDYTGLIQALGRVSQSHPFEVLLTGRGVSEDEGLLHEIEQAGLVGRVHLRGATRDVSETFSALDVHVLVSRFGEGFPNVVAEAMACGALSISTDSGDAYAIVHSPEMISPMNDVEALADTLDRALMDKVNWPSRSELRERIQRNFDITRMVAGFHEAWGVN